MGNDNLQKKPVTANVMAKLVSGIRNEVKTRGGVIFFDCYEDAEIDATKTQMEDEGNLVVDKRNGLLVVVGEKGGKKGDINIIRPRKTMISPTKYGKWFSIDDKDRNFPDKKYKGNGIFIFDDEYTPGKLGKDKEGRIINQKWADYKLMISEKLKEHMRKHKDDDTYKGVDIDNYKFEGIEYIDSKPDFSIVSFGTVKMKKYSNDRDTNYQLATEVFSEQSGYSEGEIKDWMEENNMSWHEEIDENGHATMMKVPFVIHGNYSHTGAVNALNTKGSTVLYNKTDVIPLGR